MPDTKNFNLRVRILDGQRRRDGVSMQEILQVFNRRLDDRGVKAIKAKGTILKDLTGLANEYNVRIVRGRNEYDSRVIR